MFVFNISKTFCLKEVFVPTHASFKRIRVLIVESYANILEHTCKLASAASLQMFCYVSRIKILLGYYFELLARFLINAGFLLQSCHKDKHLTSLA